MHSHVHSALCATTFIAGIAARLEHGAAALPATPALAAGATAGAADLHVVSSDSASGEYVKHRLLDKLGIRRQMEGRAAQVPATPVGEVIAQGEADFGCQQRSEPQPVQGIDIVGLLPPANAAAVEATGLEPIAATH